MREQKVLPKEFDFYFPHLDNMVLVKCHEDGCITIRMTKDNLSEKQKTFFIHQLAAEGFIPDEYQWFSNSREAASRVRWIKDYSWVKMSSTVRRRANHAMMLLLIGGAILWLAMMRVVIVSNPPGAAAPNANATAASFQRTASLDGEQGHSGLLAP